MIKDILLGQYYPGGSFLHTMDPRAKIISLLLWITSTFLLVGPMEYMGLLAVILGGYLLAGIPLRVVARSVKPLWILLIITTLIHAFSTPGEVVYSWRMLAVTREGLTEGFVLSMRLIALILLSSLLTFTTTPIALTDGVERLLQPLERFGVPAHEMAMMMTIALRFIPILLEEADRILKAQMARGADFSRGNLLQRAKNLVPILVPLFLSAFQRADDLATAMEARCYRGGAGRTRLYVLQMRRTDWLIGMVSAAGVGVFIFRKASQWL